MSVTIVSEESKLIEHGKAAVVVEGRSWDSVTGLAAKRAAEQYASQALGLGACALDIINSEGVYNPLPDGTTAETEEDVQKLAQHQLLHGGAVNRFRKKYTFAATGPGRGW